MVKYLVKPTITLLDENGEVVTVQIINQHIWIRNKNWSGGNGAAFTGSIKEMDLFNNFHIDTLRVECEKLNEKGHYVAGGLQYISGTSLDILKQWIRLLK